MTKRETYESRTEAFLLPLVAEHQFELVDVEYVKEGSSWYLRAYIDKEGGIAIDDCETISRALSDWTGKILSATAIFWKSVPQGLEGR